VTAMSKADSVLLSDIRLRNTLMTRFSKDLPLKDTTRLMDEFGYYIHQYAPRHSAFRILEEGIQYLIEQKMYDPAADLLTQVAPLFPDTLPRKCNSNFEFQRRAKPFINGKVPILRQPAHDLQRSALAEINTTEGSEFSPVLSADGQRLFFAAEGRRDNIQGVDIFSSQWQGDMWSKPTIQVNLSGPGEQIPLSLRADGQQMLLLNNGNLCFSFLSADSVWSAPQKITLSGIAYVGKGVLSADGKAIVLEGSYARGNVLSTPDVDIFISFQSADGIWTTPVALGSDINTDGDEGNPFLSADGQYLYYTSTGYPGLGAADVFVSRRTQSDWKHWTRPQHLGKELNDTYPQRGLGHVNAEGTRAWYSFFSKNAEKGDIWTSELPKRQE
jgi:hypothetical protein